MDPKVTPPPASPGSTPGLDPNLQATYDKVMNFNPSAPQPMTTSPANPVAPAAPTDPMNLASAPVQPANPMMATPPANTPAEPNLTPANPPATSTPATGMFSTAPEPTPVAGVSPAPVATTVVINNDASPHEDKATGVSAKKKGGSIMPLIFILGAIIFIALYAVIWVKIFNIQVPFLPF